MAIDFLKFWTISGNSGNWFPNFKPWIICKIKIIKSKTLYFITQRSKTKMRFFVVTMVIMVAMPLIVSGLDVDSLLRPILKKTSCVMPCLANSANQFTTCNRGLFTAICNNVDEIVAKARPCIKKCGVDKSVETTSVKLLKNFCKKSPQWCTFSLFGIQ